MRIDLKEIFYLQTELDKHIHHEHNVTYQVIQPELKLALLVELAECANEIRSFKFWSLKGPSDKSIVLEEYVDAIHFITAICLSYHTDTVFDIQEQTRLEAKRDITNGFIEVFTLASNIKDAQSAYNWYKKYLEFGFKLGFSIEDIIEAYKAKCKINHQRQDNKY